MTQAITPLRLGLDAGGSFTDAVLLDVAGRLGVRLTESVLMIPRKSLSGLIFPSDRPFVSCRPCDTRDCPGRQAPCAPEAVAEEGHG